jgi:hypothetical protein
MYINFLNQMSNQAWYRKNKSDSLGGGGGQLVRLLLIDQAAVLFALYIGTDARWLPVNRDLSIKANASHLAVAFTSPDVTRQAVDAQRHAGVGSRSPLPNICRYSIFMLLPLWHWT